MPPEKFKLFTPTSAPDLNALRLLFEEYASGLGIDLCFQNFSVEIAGLPGGYARPHGALLLVKSDQQAVGCCGLRALHSVDYSNACEMKRLYVRAVFRGCGLGRLLAESILDSARQAGYSHVLLDTLTEMETARALYKDLGFIEIPPYYHNPIAGAHYLMAAL